VPAGYVALVNQVPVLTSDYMNQLRNETGLSYEDASPEQRKKVLDEMIDEELVVQRGLALNLPETTTEVRTALYDAVNAQVAEGIAGERPTDQDLQAYYQANRSKFATLGSMRLTDIVLHYGTVQDADQTLEQAQADAAEAVYQLQSGASLDYVMQHFGFVETSVGNNGEMYDYAAEIQLGKKLFAVASKMTDGEISDPIATPDGVHVIIMDQRKPPVFTDFNNVRNNVYADYVHSEQLRVQSENVQMLRSRAKILIAPDAKE
jgi:parvulin-like peptidyl-prolyl isomerase